MKRYDSYKDSGIDWIGEIPEHWELKKLKHLAKIFSGQDHKNVWDDKGEFPIIGTGGIFGMSNRFLTQLAAFSLKKRLQKPKTKWGENIIQLIFKELKNRRLGKVVCSPRIFS